MTPKVISTVLSIVGFVGLILLFILSHQLYFHGSGVISKKDLDDRLYQFGEKYRETLLKDFYPSHDDYCPATRSARPVKSYQLLQPDQRKVKEYIERQKEKRESNVKQH